VTHFSRTLSTLCLTVLMVSAANADMLTTIFNTNVSPDNGNMFDVVTPAGPGVVVKGFDLNLDTGSYDLALWIKTGTWVGNELNPGNVWGVMPFATISGLVGAGIDSPTHWNTPNFPILASSIQGIYITSTNGGLIYDTQGTGIGTAVASNAMLTINEGASLSDPFLSPIAAPRIWNGTIYTNNVVPVPAAAWLFGSALGLLGWMRRKRAATI
jgi:hypothetical protein